MDRRSSTLSSQASPTPANSKFPFSTKKRGCMAQISQRFSSPVSAMMRQSPSSCKKRASAVFHDEPAVSFCACHGGTDSFTRFTRHGEIFHCRGFVDVDVPVLHTARVDTPVHLAAEVFVKSRVNGNHGMTLFENRGAAFPYITVGCFVIISVPRIGDTPIFSCPFEKEGHFFSAGHLW